MQNFSRRQRQEVLFSKNEHFDTKQTPGRLVGSAYMIVQSKNNIFAVILLNLSIVACMLFSGGLRWECCIIPNLLLFIIAMVKRKKVVFDCSTLLFIILILFGAISICFTLGDKQYAVHEYEKILCLILAYYVGVAVDEKNVLKAIGLLGLILAIFGLLSYCNFIRIDEFVFNDRKILRLQSFVKYANTTAVLLGCCYFAVINLYKDNKKKYFLYISGCILTAFFLTISKAAIPIFIFIVTGLILSKNTVAKEMMFQIAVCLITAIITILLVKNCYNSVSFIIIVVGIIISAKTDLKFMDSKFVPIIWVLTLLIGIISVFALAIVEKYDIFATLFTRFDYMLDALTLLKKHWLFGIGSGCWKYYQYAVQSSQYNITYIHNGFLQFWLENGIVAFAALVLLIARGIYAFAKEKKYISLAMLAYIVLHSFIDFNMSFGIFLIIMGLILGNGANTKNKNVVWNISGIISLILCLMLLTYSVGEFVLRSRFEKTYINNDYVSSLKYAEKLEKMCPYDSNLKISIAALNADKAKDNLESAIRLSPLDKYTYKTYINYLIDNGYKVEITKLAEDYINLAPKQEFTYTEIQTILDKALINGLCSQEEYENATANAERRRNKESVIDRNELLNELVN